MSTLTASARSPRFYPVQLTMLSIAKYSLVTGFSRGPGARVVVASSARLLPSVLSTFDTNATHSNTSSAREMSAVTAAQSPSMHRTVQLKRESQIVLKHLQGSYSDWVSARGLDTGLKINNDGTFSLQYPEYGWRIWTDYDNQKKQQWLKVYTVDMFSRYLIRDTPPQPVPWATLECVFQKRIRKRAIPIMLDPKRPTEDDVTTKVDEMILRLTRWGK